MPKTNRTIARALGAFVGIAVLAPNTFAAQGGARPADAPAPPAGAPGAKPDAGPTVNDPRGDRKLSEACLEIAVEKLREEYVSSLRDPRASLREKSSYFV